MKSRNLIFLFILLILILVAAPIIQIVLSVGTKWQGILPFYDWDDLYYYARIREVADGHPFIGNPFFLEHNSEMAPAFFVGDWLASLPMIFSGSVIFTVIFNLLFWSSISFFLLYKLLRAFKIPQIYSLLGSFFVSLQVYWLLLRPVVMQIVFPFIILFWCIFLIWWKEPFKKKNIILLSIVAATNFYIYSYSWQIVLATFILAGIFLVLLRRWSKIFSLIKVGLLTSIFSLPVIFYTLKQIQHPHYWETMYRIGLVDTHLPAYSVFSYGRWVIIALILYFLTTLWLSGKRMFSSPSFMFFTITGLGLIIASMSNIITGNDLDLGDHVARFTILWFSIAIFYYLFTFLVQIKRISQLSWPKVSLLSILMLICLIGVVRNIPRALPFSKLDVKNTIDLQNYAKPLKWLDEQESEPKVIWANLLISNYIPIITRHYVLFSGGGGLHLVSSKEIEERYLISHYFDNLSKDDIKKDFRIYAGFGPAKALVNNHNNKVRICHFLRLNYFGYNCEEAVEAISLRGEEYFDNLFNLYKQEIKPGISEKISKFQVSYIIKDSIYDINLQPEILGAKPIYQDERFIIYEYIPKP